MQQTDLSQEDAAVKIQSQIRGFLVRQRQMTLINSPTNCDTNSPSMEEKDLKVVNISFDMTSSPSPGRDRMVPHSLSALSPLPITPIIHDPFTSQYKEWLSPSIRRYRPVGQVDTEDTDSLISDYSELAEPVLAHFITSGVQVIDKDDLQVGNTEQPSSLISGEHQNEDLESSISPSPHQLFQERQPDECEESYLRRVRKHNLLSLAMEFAEVKRVNSDILPFGLHQWTPVLASTPDDEGGLEDNSTGSPSSDQSGEGVEVKSEDDEEPTEMDCQSDTSDQSVDNEEDDPTYCLVPLPPSALHIFPDGGGKNANTAPLREKVGEMEALEQWALKEVPLQSNTEEWQMQKSRCDRERVLERLTGFRTSPSPSTIDPHMSGSSSGGVYDSLTNPFFDQNSPYHHQNHNNYQQQMSNTNNTSSSSTIASLYSNNGAYTNAAYNGGSSARSAISIGGPAGRNRSMQMCFRNDAALSDHESVDSESEVGSWKNKLQARFVETCDREPVHVRPSRLEKSSGDHLLARQAKLQTEAKIALAQAEPMARMQLEIEKQMSKPSSVRELIGISASQELLRDAFLQDLNIAQLQVIVNDLHSRIESFNEILVKLLIERDDLHLEQGSRLIDVEDLTRRAQEIALRLRETQTRPNRTMTSGPTRHGQLSSKGVGHHSLRNTGISMATGMMARQRQATARLAAFFTKRV